jgi:hypothetical protein
MEALPFIAAVLVLFLVVRLVAGSMDADRIETYLRERRATLIAKSWAPFGTGWVGEKDSRIYEIEYVDRHGETRRATVKTSMFSGVYLTDDRIVRRTRTRPADVETPVAETPTMSPEDAPANVADELTALRAENERLKAELARREREA